MLTAIRDRVSGWVAYFIFGVISLTFALWGIDQYFGGTNTRAVAEVNGVEIPAQAFAYQYQQQRRYLQQVYGGELPSDQNDAAIKRSVVQGMIRAEVLQQEAQEAGYRVADQPLIHEISGMEAFKTNGQFDKQRYEQLLRAQQQTKASFEQNLRRQLALSYFEDGISQSAFLPRELQRELLRLKNQRRELAYFVIPADATKIKISDEAIADYYKIRRDSFQTPERVRLAYVELSERALRDNIEADDKALRRHYQEQIERYTAPEQRKASQILIKVPADAPQAAVAKAQKRANELVARLKAGEDFAALAKRYSDDDLSASSGGDLGYIARGDLAPSFEDALFSLAEGEVSGPVKTDLGFQIIKLTDIEPARVKPFEDERAEVARAYRQQEAQARYSEQAEQLLTLAYEQSSALEPAAKALDLEIKQTEWVTRQQGSGIATDPKVRAAVFKEDVLEGGYNSDMVELEPGHAVVLRVIEHEAARPQPLEAVRDDIRQVLATQNARVEAAAAGEQALADLTGGKTLQEVAEQYGATVESPGFVDRTDVTVPQPIIEVAFAMDKPAEGASFGATQLADGYAVIALRDLQPGKVDGDEATASTAQPEINYGLREQEAAYTALEQGAEIEVMQENF
jgi:peptidyl-prolyl cis-trans isomerase D